MSKIVVIVVFIFIIIISLVAFYFLKGNTPQQSGQEKGGVVTVGTTKINVEYARTADEQQQGLMYRTSLPENAGMYFVFTSSLPRAFWNQNTLMSLDIVWIRRGTVIGVSALPAIEKGLVTVYSPGNADRVLEVPSGFAAAHNIHEGIIVIE